MSNFIPGKIVKKFIAKNGDEVTIRYPLIADIDQLTTYINEISKENTFVSFSGEVVSHDEERNFILSYFDAMESMDKLYLLIETNGKIIGSSTIDRDVSHRRRSRHVGIFGLIVKKEFRGMGIGYELSKTIIEEAKVGIPGLKMITLTVFDMNDMAKGLYTKLGFKQFGSLPKSLLYKDEYVDQQMMYLELES